MNARPVLSGAIGYCNAVTVTYRPPGTVLPEPAATFRSRVVRERKTVTGCLAYSKGNARIVTKVRIRTLSVLYDTFMLLGGEW